MTNPTPTPATNEPGEFVASGGGLLPQRRGRLRRRWLIVAALLALAVAGTALALGGAFSSGGSDSSGSGDNAAATSLATVTKRTTLSETTRVNGTLGYARSYTVLGQLAGKITALPSVGRVIRNGQVLFRVDGSPVVLLYGSTPAYRTLAEGATAADLTGRDVRQLNRDLVALGYASRADLDPSSDEFGWATRAGIENLQERLGVDETGELDVGQVVFLPTAARVTGVHGTLGGAATGIVLRATSTTRRVSVDLDASLQSQVKQGDRVTITLPDNSSTHGTISSVGTVASVPSSSGSSGSGDSTATVSVYIRPTDAADTGSLDQAPVQVAITSATVRHVLAVPVNALLALSGGGYAVEVVNANGTHHLVPVRPGLFADADGLVQVSGSGLAAEQRVVVPAS